MRVLYLSYLPKTYSDGIDEDDDSDASATSSLAYGRMTARQRARELGNEAVDELVSLPMGQSTSPD